MTDRTQAPAGTSGPDGMASRGHHLSSCASCARVTRHDTGAATTCEFCGGALRPMWGLGQLAGRRTDRDTHAETPPPAVRETTG